MMILGCFSLWLVVVHTVAATNSISVEQAIRTLQESSRFIVCRLQDDESSESSVPYCQQASTPRYLFETEEEETLTWISYTINAVGALTCVSLAALAAGLTLGLLGLDPLVLLIKERAATDETERAMAKQLLPIVQQHHRLLVTLLLLNACANEALPLFLESLVPPAVAVLVSVTLVLFFGEIIPSAIFTGPNQLIIATHLLPLVKVLMWIAYPLAFPIAKLLDHVLHGDTGDDDDAHTSAAYTRSELSALIRIQYEERLAKRRHHKNQTVDGDHVGALDFTPKVVASSVRAKSVRATMNQLAHADGDFFDPTSSLRHDEVLMVEGALHMSTKVAIDVFTPIRKVFSVPKDMLLTEANLVKIYAAGYTRVPIHMPDNPKAICGILMTRFLIVVNGNTSRSVDTLPIRTPRCVGPNMSLVHLLNLLQHGGSSSSGGHLALVCARPHIAEAALAEPDGFVPEEAGLMGIITLEDVLEMLLQEVCTRIHSYVRWSHTFVLANLRRNGQTRASGTSTGHDDPQALAGLCAAKKGPPSCRGGCGSERKFSIVASSLVRALPMIPIPLEKMPLILRTTRRDPLLPLFVRSRYLCCLKN